MSPPTSPNSRSRSSGDSARRPSTLALKFGATPIDGVDHQVGDLVARVVPRSARRDPRQVRMHVLAEEARDVHAGRRERIIDDRRNQHLDDRRRRPARRLRVEVRALHVAERRRDHDAARVVRLPRPCPAARRSRAARTARRSCGTFPSRTCTRRCARGSPPADARARRARSNSSFGLTLATTRARAIDFAALELDARRAPAFDDHARGPAASVRSVTPRAAHSFAIACVIAPMPPLAWPHWPRLPFTSPKT